ncbi:MAG: tetracycline resistance efflux pump [Halioglobus sp.]|jgi:tetracycline resistance efflux pump
MTWVLGLAIFFDDYLNSLTVSSSMKKVTDKYKTSREMLSYVVYSTAAPICLIIPISTWAVYFAGLLEKNGVAAKGEGIDVFIQSIPGVVPLMGRMKTAEQPAESTGQVVPTGSEHIDIDVLVGVMAGILATLAQYFLQGVLKPVDMYDTLLDGLKVMVPVLTILVSVFIFIEGNNALGMSEYVIGAISPYMSAWSLPVLAFMTMSVSVPLMAGALLSASGFGSHACFYRDSTVLAAQGSGCAPYDHAVSQLPSTLIAAGLSALGFLIVAL